MLEKSHPSFVVAHDKSLLQKYISPLNSSKCTCTMIIEKSKTGEKNIKMCSINCTFNVLIKCDQNKKTRIYEKNESESILVVPIFSQN